MMAAVALLAFLLAAVDQLRRRRESFRLRAEVCRRAVSAAYLDEQAARGALRVGHDPRTTAAYFRRVEHYDALRVKYERAAARPWLPVEPDPPEPQ
jgi:hypothetical protein